MNAATPTQLPVEQVRQLFDLTGERWTVPVLSELRGTTLRFTEMRRALDGVSQKQLAHTLRNLERDGYVLRTAYPTIPPRVEYRLTELGGALVERLTVIGRFVVERGAEIENARQRFSEAAAGRHRPGA